MPDFFVDHFVLVDKFEDFLTGLRRLAEQGGGNLMNTTQMIRRGGNSINTASALLSLGADPCPIVATDEYGASMLRGSVNPKLDLSHVHTDGRLSATVSIETEYLGRKVNLMVSDSGSAAGFEFSMLKENDLDAIRNSGLVALLCLNHNRHGANLAEDLFRMVHDETSATTYLDIGDPSDNMSILQPLVSQVLSEDLVDILGMNENEACRLAWVLSGEDDHWRGAMQDSTEWLNAAKLVSKETGVRVDLHTPEFSASIKDDETTMVSTFKVECRIMCGAGDAWNAGNIYGTLAGLQTMDRLHLADAVAALYVSSTTATHPSREDVVKFLSSTSAVP
ncbi:MAG: carbohydrate kinase family protein [Candidatus Thorarchaeota archaeon]